MEKASEGKVLVTVTTEGQVTRCGGQAACVAKTRDM